MPAFVAVEQSRVAAFALSLSPARLAIFDNSKGRAGDARWRATWRALLDALPGGEAETQAAVNRPIAGSNPALAAKREYFVLASTPACSGNTSLS